MKFLLGRDMKKEGMKNILILAGIFILDRITKYVLFDKCLGIFCIRTEFNTGASFGILPGLIPLFIVAASMILVLMGYFYNKVDSRTKLAFVFIAAGTLGNLIDRVFLGGVIDLFAIWRSSSFNIADISNLIGGIILIFIIFSSGRTKGKKKH